VGGGKEETFRNLFPLVREEEGETRGFLLTRAIEGRKEGEEKKEDPLLWKKKTADTTLNVGARRRRKKKKVKSPGPAFTRLRKRKIGPLFETIILQFLGKRGRGGWGHIFLLREGKKKKISSTANLRGEQILTPAKRK